MKIYKAEVKGPSTSSHNTQNIAFMSSNNTNSTNKSVDVVPSVSAASSKASISTLPNVDSLSDAMIYSFFTSYSNSPQLDNEDLKQIDADDLEEMDLKWQMAMLTMRARRFLQRTGRNLGANGTVDIGFDMSNVECYNCHRKCHFSRGCRSPRDNRNKDTLKRTVQVEVTTSNALVSQCNAVGGYDWSLESVEARLVVYQHNENVFEEDIKLLKLDVMLRDNALVALRKKFEKTKKERDDLKLTLEKNSDFFQKSNYESDNSVPKSPENDRYKSGEGYHVVPPPYTGTFMPLKPDLVFNDAHNASETVTNVFNAKSSTNKPSKDMSKTLRPDAPMIKDWISNSKDETEIESVPKQKKPSFVPTSEHVKPPRKFVKKVKHPKQDENLRTDNQKSRVRMTHPHSNENVVLTAVLTRSRLVSLNATKHVPTVVPHSVVKSLRPVKHVINKGNPQQALKDKGVIDSGCSRHMTDNISYLLDFEEINGGYVAFGGNPKGGNILGKGKIKTCKLDFDDVYFVKELKFNLFTVSQMVLRENNMYNVDLKNVVPLRYLTCLFAKATLKESNLWHIMLGHINFKTMNKLFCRMKGIKREFSIARTPQQNVFAERKNRTLIEAARTRLADSLLPIPFWVEAVNTTCCGINLMIMQVSKKILMQNTDVDDAAFDVKENENEVCVSPSESDKTKKHNDKAKRDDKGKSPVDSPTGVRDLRAEFEEFSVNNTNRVNAVSAPINVVRLNLTNSTNSFNNASPSDTTVSPNFKIARKSSFVDTSKYHGDPDMPELEDIVYSDDEEDVGAEADLSNLETNIPVNLIPTTRVYKDHPVNQIISDLNSAPQTRSMTRMVKEQEPKKVHQALKDPSWIEAMQEELLQFKMQKMDVKSAFLYGTIEEKVYVCQPLGFEDPDYPDKVYKVVKALCGLHQAPRAWKFGFINVKLASTPIETEKPLLKDPDGEDVDVHIYMSMIGSLMYLISFRPDIMFAVCACAQFQVTLKVSHLHAVKRNFRYLKGTPHLGLWYPKASPFNLVAYSDSDFAEASLDRKFTTGGC
nr:uncharacterized mitochondrial protein AtMg00810-like [Tanacetum cinerariifolium]